MVGGRGLNNWAILVLLVAAVAFGQAIFFRPSTSSQTCVWFLDIGQGDSIYIKTSDQKEILIDGGPDDKVLAQLSKLRDFSDRELDLVIATHPDKDHIGGLDEVLKKYQIKEIWWNGEQKETQVFKDFWQAARQEEAEGALLKTPELFQTKIFDQGQIQVIYGAQTGESNERSLITLFTQGETDFLFTADLPFEKESLLPQKDIEVLKVGHHGSKTSTSSQLLDRMQPEYAVISVGKNSYGHPDKIVLDRLSERDIKTLRTDEQGNVGFCLTDNQLNLQNGLP